MADHSSINTSESSAFSAMYRLQTQSQRSNYSLLLNNPTNRINQYVDSGLLDDPAENCANAATSMNGVGEQINAVYWDMESLISSQPGVLNRNKAHSESYEEEWNSQQQDTMENYGSTEGNHQKLDSFSEAFYSRNISRLVDQVGYNADPNNSSNIPSLPFLSFPLVLSPPPTPLPQPSLSPPKRAACPPAAQSVSQAQSQTPSEGSLRFFPPFSCTNSILPVGFSPTQWLPLSTETSGSEDRTQHLLQDLGPSAVYSEGMGIQLRDLSATEGDTDCSLEACSPCSPLLQPPPPQAVPKLEREHYSVTSDHHMTWSQMMPSSQQFCPPSHHLNNQVEGLRMHEDTKPIAGFQQTHVFCLPSSENNLSAVHTGIPFYSVLRSGVLGGNREHMTHHYTPLPMLNPTRSGTGLYCNLLLPSNHQEQLSLETGHCAQQRQVNIGPEFQAQIPDLLEQEGIEFQEPPKEELLWKPWAELEGNDDLLDQVENLLDLSTSTALPGGVANLELALHNLYLYQGNILAALERMLFSNSKPSRDYHYSGSDVWRLSEQKLFQKAFNMYGKDFSFIQKMVQSKGVSQCVEFYYHSKRLRDKQRKLKEKELQQQQVAAETLTPTNQVMLMNPINVDRLIHTPALAPSFPCKQCGKMFYKIKSRNAHMKIHRQQQDDWRDRIHPNNHLSLTRALQNQNRILNNPKQLVTQGHPNQLLTHSLIQNLVQTQTQLAFIQSSKTQHPCFTSATSSTNCTQSPQMVPKALTHCRVPQQTWGASSLESGLYYD